MVPLLDSRPGAAPSSLRTYERIAIPALVVEGACDKLLPPGWAQEIADRLLQGRSAVIAAAGHCPQLEKPVEVNALLLDFLASVE